MDPVRSYPQFQHMMVGRDYILKVCGEVDVYTEPLLTAALQKGFGAGRIIVDFTECRYADARAISALVRARKQAAVPIHLVLETESILRRILRITKVDGLFVIFPTLEAAAA